MSQFDEPVTRDFIRAENAELKAELKGDIAGLRIEVEKQLRSTTYLLAVLIISSIGATSAIVTLAG